MYGINLHNIVQHIIAGIHHDKEIIIYKSNGQINIKGIIVPIYLTPIKQVQHIDILY